MAEPQSIGAAIQDILTRGLDVAATYYTTRLQVNDPTTSVAGVNGQRVAAGQPARGVASAMSGIPTWALVAGGVLLGVAVLALVRKA